MGRVILDRVVRELSAGGIRTETAFPATEITRIVTAVAAVSIDEVNRQKHTVTILVEIFAPQNGGGYACQDKAVDACDILEGMGAVCRQGSCSFVNKGNVFRVPVWAVFQEENVLEFEIVTGPLRLNYACGFSAEQVRGTSTESMQELPWEFTVEEFFPWGTLDTLEADEPFELYLRSDGGTEQFDDCKWTQRKRMTEERGIRQIRTGTATKRWLTGN